MAKKLGRGWVIYSYNFIIIFVSSIALFLFFKEFKIQNKSLNKLSSLTLGVYLIHDHSAISSHIYKLLKYENSFYSSTFIIKTLCIVAIIYIVSSAIEYIRVLLFERIKKHTSGIDHYFYEHVKEYI